jgi:hypothetical protein
MSCHSNHFHYIAAPFRFRLHHSYLLPGLAVHGFQVNPITITYIADVGRNE